MLHAIKHDLKTELTPHYAVISAIAGVPTSQVLRAHRKVSNMPGAWVATPKMHFANMLSMFGYALVPSLAFIPSISLRLFLREQRYLFRESPVIVRLDSPKGKLLAVYRDHVAGMTHLVPTPFADVPRHWKVSAADKTERRA